MCLLGEALQAQEGGLGMASAWCPFCHRENCLSDITYWPLLETHISHCPASEQGSDAAQVWEAYLTEIQREHRVKGMEKGFLP